VTQNKEQEYEELPDRYIRATFVSDELRLSEGSINTPQVCVDFSTTTAAAEQFNNGSPSQTLRNIQVSLGQSSGSNFARKASAFRTSFCRLRQ